MKLARLTSLSFSLLSVTKAANLTLPGLPSKIYGTNLGSWLLIEPWMLPQEWVDMGGERCAKCSTCIASEFAFAKAYPDTVDQTMKKHWQTWFTQSDIDELKRASLNTVRIPLGYWIVEPLVDRSSEYYAKGGILELKRGLKQLKDAGIAVILDHHALPGVSSPNQMFAGNCTEQANFYTPYNHHRALVWTAVMTAISHLDPAFSAVASIQAINEPIMDARETPGLEGFQRNFVQTVRAVEHLLCVKKAPGHRDSEDRQTKVISANNVTHAFDLFATSETLEWSAEVKSVLKDSIQSIVYVANQLKMQLDFDSNHLKNRVELVTNFMDVGWQWGPHTNPADYKDGPQAYDAHLYYAYGGVAEHNEQAYMTHICNLQAIEDDALLGNTPLWFGEWSLTTGFPASDEFLKKFADAQKRAFNKGAGWLFWNFKYEVSELAGDRARQWSYFEALKRGYFTVDPTAYNDPGVCNPYISQ